MSAIDYWVLNTDTQEYIPIDHVGMLLLRAGVLEKPDSGELIGEIYYSNGELKQITYVEAVLLSDIG